MSVSVVSSSIAGCELCVEESTWTARVLVQYKSDPGVDHHEGRSIATVTGLDSRIVIDVEKEECTDRRVSRNIHTFPYHRFMCAEAWTVVWGKLYAPC